MKKFLIFLLTASVFAQTDYFQQDVKYDINVSLNDTLHTLTGDLTLNYKNNSPDTLTYVWFHLWPNAYKNTETAYAKQEFEGKSSKFQFAHEKSRGYIDSVRFNVAGQTVDHVVHDEWIDVVKVPLPTPLPPGNETVIKTPFFVKIPEVFSRFGHTGRHYEITQWYPKPAVYDNNGWHPMPYLDQGEFYSEFGTFDVKITLPEDYRIMATGDLVNGEKEYLWLDSLAVAGDSLHALDKKEFKKVLKNVKKENRKKRDESTGTVKTLHFHQENVHDFAWFADREYIVRKGTLMLEDSTRPVTLWSMYLPKNAKLWENSIEYIHDAGYWYSEFVGPYPYNHITAVDGDLSAGGGMEYPNITVISSGGSRDLLEFVIMHEVGHNWFYGILGSNERIHTWIDEGFNEWINQKYFEKKFGQRKGAKFVISDMIQNKIGIGKSLNYLWLSHTAYTVRAITGDEQPLSLSAAEFEPANYGIMNYMKTGSFSFYLGKYLGDSLTNELLHEYYDTWSFKHPRPDDFEKIARNTTNEDLDWYFDDMVGGQSYIDYEADKRNGEFIIRNNGTLPAPLQVAVYDHENSELSREWVDGFTGSRTFSPVENASKLVIDPDQIMPDVKKYNNSTSKDFNLKFVFDVPSFYDHDIFVVPWFFSFNEYNSLAPGLMFYSGYIPGFDYGISVLPQWDFANGQAVGKVSAQKTFYKKGPFRSMTISSTASKFEGRTGLALNFSGLTRKPVYRFPNITTSGSLYYHSLDSLALNPNIYDNGSFVTAVTGLTYENYPSWHLRYRGNVKAAAGASGGNFLKVSAEGWIKYRINNKFETQARLWVGGFLLDDAIPLQYSIFMNGGVDPNFKEMVIDRTDNGGKGYYNVTDEQYIEDGPGLHGGASISPSREIAWGLNISQKVFDTFNLYFDAVGATDLDIYLTSGLSLSTGSITLYIPLYQSWESDSTPTDIKWIKNRIQFEISLSGLGGIF